MSTGPAPTLGLDLGSVSLNLVVLDPAREILFQRYRRTQGRPLAAARALLAELHAELGDLSFTGGVVTGSGKELLAGPLGLGTENEIVAHATAAWTRHPDVAAVIEIGGQDSKYIRVGRDADGRPFLEHHAFNELCAAGTGAFLDQQAGRLGLAVEELGALAARAATPARVAGRCSVFAKTDMIHLQQKATPTDEIAAGLCFALARNYLASLCRGRVPRPPVLIQGGVAGNAGVVRAFRELLGLGADDLRRPEHHRVMGALGAALLAAEQPRALPDLSALRERLENHVAAPAVTAELPPLRRPAAADAVGAAGTSSSSASAPGAAGAAASSAAASDAPLSGAAAASAAGALGAARGQLFLGLDVGSVSTKVAVIGRDAELIASAYVPTAGRPVTAVREALATLAGALPTDPVLTHAVCTGSGRHLARALLGCGGVLDEISAQARAAVHLWPEVDTVLEIGGQDSKYLRLDSGRVERFQMNRACAAGTGAFLEEQAGRLGVRIREEFAERAFAARAPVRLGSRCTVFMDSDLVHHLQRGADTDDLCAGLAHSIGENFLEKVVGSRPLGRRILFQGGVAANAAVHAVFQQLLDREVRVHPHPEVSGALGAALSAREQAAERDAEAGFRLSALEIDAETTTFECRRCENVCEVRKVTVRDGRTAFFGSVCGRFERADRRPVPPDDAFAIRERLLHETVRRGADPAIRGAIGFPDALSMRDYLPFWQTFFSRLGFEVILSPLSRRDVVEWGLAHVPAEFCYPLKILFGHVNQLRTRGVERVFIPHLRMLTPPTESQPRYACPYTQAAPYVVRANVDLEVVSLEYPVDGEVASWLRDAARELGIDRREVAAAHAEACAAEAEFRRRCREEGAAILARLEQEGRRGAVLLGRPYNTTDRYVNLNLARRLQELDIEPLPYDFLPLGDDPLPQLWMRIRWGYGRKLVQAARVLKQRPNLGAVIVTNFGCGPDAFIDQYLEYELHGTPHILLEFDDHQAEAGLITRLEAFSQTFQVRTGPPPPRVTGPDRGRARRPLRELTYYMPAFMDHAYAYTGALRGSGCKAVLLPPTDDESWQLGLQHAYGRECHPFISFTGDLLKATRRPDFVPDEACYYGPSYFGSCLLPQYMLALHLILERLGLEAVTVMNIADPPTMKELGNGYVVKLALGMYAIDRLFKWKTEAEPYEREPGAVDRVHRENLRIVEAGLAEGDFFASVARAVARFRQVPLDDRLPLRPRIGIVGDQYTRVNEHSNNQLYRRLKDMGFEVWTSCSLVDVSFLGIEQLHAEQHRRGQHLKGLASRSLVGVVRAFRHLVDRLFPDELIRTPQERQYPAIRKTTERYTSFWIDKALSANISRIEELHLGGADGVINTLCHNCMLGTVTGALSGQISADLDDLPICNLVYEGLQSTHNVNRLEAFAHQVKGRRGRG